MDKTLTMSTKELSRLEVMQRLKDKRLIQKEAATVLTEYSADQTTMAEISKAGC
ncbi:hypothetical protein [Candidatus Villigracilis saccharophilus]|uniref:hypothetical protein n=1 Tax=Candidatus Villigracilis saccharophilus TaxID=3140684 RepID=UPI003136188E|nr:hypothetical protein [Anaerolineales bacterium]